MVNGDRVCAAEEEGVVLAERVRGRRDGAAALAGERDRDALERVFRAYEGTVYTMARRICRTSEDAEDVLQETFLEICRSIGTLRGTEPGSLTAWVKRVATSKALMRVRREQYRDADELREEDPVAGRRGPDVALQLDLETALQRLSDRARAVVWLHDVEGYTHAEIGIALGRTPSFSKSQLSRAHARLRDLLADRAPIKEGAPCTPA